MMNLLLIITSVLLNCAAQIFIKKGMLQIGEINMGSIPEFLLPMVTNIFLWIAMLCYGVSIFLWMAVLSKVEVSFAYPFLSIGYVVAAIAGYYLFGESMSVTKILGILVICVGVILISKG